MGSVTNQMPKRLVARASKSWLAVLKRSNADAELYGGCCPQSRSGEDITVSVCEDTCRYAGSIIQTCRSSNPTPGVRGGDEALQTAAASFRTLCAYNPQCGQAAITGGLGWKNSQAARSQRNSRSSASVSFADSRLSKEHLQELLSSGRVTTAIER
jgi:hypothetical protein